MLLKYNKNMSFKINSNFKIKMIKENLNIGIYSLIQVKFNIID